MRQQIRRRAADSRSAVEAKKANNANDDDVDDGFHIPEPPEKRLDFDATRRYILENYSQFIWPVPKLKNECPPPDFSRTGGATSDPGMPSVVKFSPTQEFVRHFFTPRTPTKGLLLYASTGSGKTCTAIAAASTTFERDGWTILWVTRTTLTKDIYKNIFEQTCSETIKRLMRANKRFRVPDDPRARMALIPQWIKPITYRQFTNMVQGTNDIYQQLTRRNGARDPLRKTFLIIDEAHKLYGGNDLVAAEKPDVNKLRKALMDSYVASGADSVKVLLMTATPITSDPMELIKLLNLVRPPTEQMPERFDEFAKRYGVSANGRFPPEAESKFLDDISMYVSYLNREGDPSQFARPVVHPKVLVPMSSSGDRITQEDLKQKYDRDMQAIQADMRELKEKAAFARADAAQLKRDAEEACSSSGERRGCVDEARKASSGLLAERVRSIKDEEAELKEDIVRMKREQQVLMKRARARVDDISQETIAGDMCGWVPAHRNDNNTSRSNAAGVKADKPDVRE